MSRQAVSVFCALVVALGLAACTKAQREDAHLLTRADAATTTTEAPAPADASTGTPSPPTTNDVGPADPTPVLRPRSTGGGHASSGGSGGGGGGGGTGHTVALVALSVLCLGVLVPLAEEVCYRGLLLHALMTRWGPLTGAVVTSAAWAMVSGSSALTSKYTRSIWRNLRSAYW